MARVPVRTVLGCMEFGRLCNFEQVGTSSKEYLSSLKKQVLVEELPHRNDICQPYDHL